MPRSASLPCLALAAAAAVALAHGSTPAYSLARYRRADDVYGSTSRGMQHRLFPMSLAVKTPGSAVLVDVQATGVKALSSALANKNVTGIVLLLPQDTLDVPTAASLHLVELQALARRRGRPVSLVAVPQDAGVAWGEVGAELQAAAPAKDGSTQRMGQHLWDFHPLRSIRRVVTSTPRKQAPARIHTLVVGPPGWEAAPDLLVITAHTDCLTMFPGLPGCADANGSGMATLLALMRAAASPSPGSPAPLLLFTGGGVLHWAGLRNWLAHVPSPTASRIRGVVSIERLGGSPDGPLWAHWPCGAEGSCPQGPQWAALQQRVSPAVQRSHSSPIGAGPASWGWEGHAAAAAGFPSVTLSAAGEAGDAASDVEAGDESSSNSTSKRSIVGAAMRADGFDAAGPLGGRWSFLDSTSALHVPALARRCTEIVAALTGSSAVSAGAACEEGALRKDLQAVTGTPRSPGHMSDPEHPALQFVRQAAEAAGWSHTTLSTDMDETVASHFAVTEHPTATLRSVRPFEWEMEAFLASMALGLLAYLLAAGPRTCPCQCYRAGPVWSWLGYAALSHSEKSKSA